MATCPVTKRLIEVAETRDASYVARLIKLATITVQSACENGCQLYEVRADGERCGCFVVRSDGPCRAELHTELQLKGAEALDAARKLLDILRAAQIKTLTTYATKENRKAMVGAVYLGFRRIATDPDGTARYACEL